MKKFYMILFTILTIICFTSVTQAKKCTVVSGIGKNIGDEIACGTEHFYVIENDGENIKMLAKYNLYVGANYDKIKIDINETYEKSECSNNDNCYQNSEYYFENEHVASINEWESRILEKYNLDSLHSLYDVDASHGLDEKMAYYTRVNGDKYTENGKTYQNYTYKLYPLTRITNKTEGYALQNELARGVTGEKGNANYPIYATFNIFYQDTKNGFWNPRLSDYIKNYNSFKDGYVDFELKDNINSKIYLSDYKTKLNELGYDISSIDFISVKDINDLVYAITEEELPLSDWYEDADKSHIDSSSELNYRTLGDLKEYLSNDYSWLWNTSFWTKTLQSNEEIDLTDSAYYLVYFVSSSGEICYSYSQCSGIPRAGIRPVVTLSASEIDYKIETKTDGNGTLTSEKVRAIGGEVIKFTVEPKEGYVLGSIKVTDSEGNTIVFTENTFTMPNADVLIEATFVKAESLSEEENKEEPKEEPKQEDKKEEPVVEQEPEDNPNTITSNVMEITILLTILFGLIINSTYYKFKLRRRTR